MWRASLFSALIPRRGMGCLAATAVLWLLSTGIVLAAAPPCPSPLVERQRYGFVATSPDWPQRFSIAQLRAGWYVDFQPSAAPSVGMDRALVIKVRTGYIIDPEVLGSLVDGYPGALWLIGNEPDCIWQDNVMPEEYARIYHNLYYFIKNRDRTSQIAAGSIVQPTPLRLQYLDRVLAAYRVQYGRAMPVDVWNIHNAILREERGSWGAGIPPGIDADVGVLREVQDNDNMTIFRDQIWAFRQWLADRGYGGYPLVVTEYGILMPEEYGFTPSRVNAFMSSTFSFLSTAVDGSLGDPSDGNRLVQRWAWFSLDVQPWDPITGGGFNGNLFDPVTTGITTFGQHYADHTSSFPPVEYVDLGLAAWDTPSPPLVVSPTQTISYSLRVKIVNRGTVDAGDFAVTLAYSGPTGGTLTHLLANAPAVSSQWVTFTLENLQGGGYLLSLELDPDHQVAEVDECNNLATRTLVVPRVRNSLPLVLSRMTGKTTTWSQNQPGAGGGQQPAPGSSQPAGTADRRSTKADGSAPRAADQHVPLPDKANALTGSAEFEMPTLGSYPAQLALDAERQVLWVTERDGAKLAAFDLLSQTWGLEYELAAGSQPWGVAVDEAGNVWFAETGAGRIGELDVDSGDITEHVIPTANSEPWDVAVGGDGTIWFTEKGGNKIGRLVPGTGVTEYPVPSPGAQPGGIAVAYSAVWFTLTASDQLGWFETDTEVMEVLPRPPGSRPQDIVLTSLNNPWFTEAGGNRIVLFSPSTAFLWTLVDVRTPDAEPYGIAMEGDVAVWFTERAGNKLGRYAGSVPPKEYALPTPNSLPTGIVVDDAGCAWYTAPGANRIGRFCVPEYAFDTYLPLVVRN